MDGLKFDEKGLITAVVQDAQSKEVLTVAYMNEESLQKTIETGETWFYSRSRQELWHKGATSVEIIRKREADMPEGAYTTYLFEKGIDKICKKVGEEATEVVIGAKNRDAQEVTWEAADLIYHLLVLLQEQKI
ncbi:phosphoribosyl-ATP dip, partial [Rhizophagus irregularis]